MTIQRLALLAMLVALCSVARLSFSWLPNFTPVTSIYLLLCLNFGLFDALIVANLTIIATSVYLGMGYWVIGQSISYSLIIILYCFVTRFLFFRHIILQAMVSFMSGIIYGFIISLFMVCLFQISAFWPYYMVGLPFDLIHGFGNFVFIILLFKPFAFFKRWLVKQHRYK